MISRVTINFDARCLQDGYADKGIGNYARGILRRLSRIENILVNVVIDRDLSAPELRGATSDLRILDLAQMAHGVYFSPSFMTHDSLPLLAARMTGLKAVGVLHDLIPLRREWESSADHVRFFKHALDLTASLDHIITVSDCTRRDYVALCGDSIPISVIHPESRLTEVDNDPVRHFPASAVRRYSTPYVFYAVADHPRKNLELAISSARAFSGLGYATVIGGGISTETVTALSSQYDLTGITFTDRLSDADLRAAYVESEAVIVPSFDEGFSLPVTEACQLGCRVLVSDIPAHREQVQDSRCIFDPSSTDSLIKTFREVLCMPATPFIRFEYDREVDRFLECLGA